MERISEMIFWTVAVGSRNDMLAACRRDGGGEGICLQVFCCRARGARVCRRGSKVVVRWGMNVGLTFLTLRLKKVWVGEEHTFGEREVIISAEFTVRHCLASTTLVGGGECNCFEEESVEVS